MNETNPPPLPKSKRNLKLKIISVFACICCLLLLSLFVKLKLASNASMKATQEFELLLEQAKDEVKIRNVARASEILDKAFAIENARPSDEAKSFREEIFMVLNIEGRLEKRLSSMSKLEFDQFKDGDIVSALNLSDEGFSRAARKNGYPFIPNLSLVWEKREREEAQRKLEAQEAKLQKAEMEKQRAAAAERARKAKEEKERIAKLERERMERLEKEKKAIRDRDEDIHGAWVYTQRFVRGKLKNPKGAKFNGYASRVVTPLGNGRYQIKASVDGTNAFNAVIRTQFTALIERNNDGASWTLHSLEFE